MTLTLPPQRPWETTFETCYVRIDADALAAGNDLFERRWRIHHGQLLPTSFQDRRTGREWFISPEPEPSSGPAELRISHTTGRRLPVEAPSLLVRLRIPGAAGEPEYLLQLFPGATGVVIQLIRHLAARPADAATAARQSTGIEQDPAPAPAADPGDSPADDAMDRFQFEPLHMRFGAITLQDRTDRHDNLYFEKQWLLHPAEDQITAGGNVFYIEHTLSGDGLVFLKQAPLPHARPVRDAHDVLLRGGQCAFTGNGIPPEGGAGYPHILLSYRGGREGRIAALQSHQQRLRRYDPQRDGLLLSNTWGDRSRDAAINEPFMLREIEAGRRLGADVIQIDDGWQQGRTANSAEKGGVWNAFWQADANFWQPHPQRLPNGLRPLTDRARRHGMRFGLWYAPDSSGDFANHQRDAEQILRLHREHGVDFFKIDGVKANTKAGEANLLRLFEHVLRESDGRITFDFDVTAETRPGYFGIIQIGPVFVENRYTDWHRYWPHHTLRNLWMLAHCVHPARLRMELLNNQRNLERYADDPLAPAAYAPDYLFATVMFASPLGWFEMSNLPPGYIEQAAPLVKLWKRHRQAIHSGPIYPIGQAPDGTAWTGFLAGDPESTAYVLLFRELNDRGRWEWQLPLLRGRRYRTMTLAGDGRVTWRDGLLRATIDHPRRYCFARLTRG